MHLLSGSVFVRMIFLRSFYYLLPVPILFLAAILILQMNSIFYDLDEQLFLEFYFVAFLFPPPLVQDKSVLNKEQERDSYPCFLFSTGLFCTKRGYSKVTK